MKIPNDESAVWSWYLSLARIVSEDSQLPESAEEIKVKSSKDS